MQIKRKNIWLILIACAIVFVVVLSLPPVWSRVTYHSREVYRIVKYWIKPPSEAVFVPSTSGNGFAATPVSAAIITEEPTSEPTTTPTATLAQFTPEATSTPEPTTTPTITPTPTLTPIPLPSSVMLKGITPERQFMNNCGPATLSMYLSYYDWGKNQLATGGVLRPNSEDVNVMPYELVDYVNENTPQHALLRYGGDLQTLKALLNAGFPVMIEKGFQPYTLRKEGWMGHYNLVVGYDDKRETLTVHDSFLMSYSPWGGDIPQDMWDDFMGFDFSYSEMEQTWRAFNNVLIVVYPPEKEKDVLNALGPLADEKEAYRIAYERAMQDTTALSDVSDQFFAWFNAGTSLIGLEDYNGAAKAFDTAFGIYPSIKQDVRPYRILWYEIGPYIAYYNAGRYQDVIKLADQTLGYMAVPILEESYYWRALSQQALGDTNSAVADLRASIRYHPGYAPSVAMLKQLGKTP